MSPAPRPKKFDWSWRSRALRALVYQVLALLVIGGAVAFLAYNTQENMRVRGIQSGFDFLGQTAGFDIGETVIAYESNQTYGRAGWGAFHTTHSYAVFATPTLRCSATSPSCCNC